MNSEISGIQDKHSVGHDRNVDWEVKLTFSGPALAPLTDHAPSPIQHDGSGAFAGLPQAFTATRYHSLAVAREDLPTELIVNAWTADGEIMGLRHRSLPAWGVQFHPESILSEHGHALLENFLRLEPSTDIEAGA